MAVKTNAAKIRSYSAIHRGAADATGAEGCLKSAVEYIVSSLRQTIDNTVHRPMNASIHEHLEPPAIEKGEPFPYNISPHLCYSRAS